MQFNLLVKNNNKNKIICYVKKTNKQTFTCTESLSLYKSKMLGCSEKHLGFRKGVTCRGGLHCRGCRYNA